MRLSQLERDLAGRGFVLERIRGSHRHYRHTQTGRRLTISAHGGRHCRFTWRRLAEIAADLSLRQEEETPA